MLIAALVALLLVCAFALITPGASRPLGGLSVERALTPELTPARWTAFWPDVETRPG